MVPVIGDSGADNVYLSVATDLVPSIGFLQLYRADGQPITKAHDLLISLHFAPKSSLHYH